MVHFATCREIKKKSEAEIDQLQTELELKQAIDHAEPLAQEEETKENPKKRGNNVSIKSSGNFTFLFGCQPGAGVSATSKLVADVINLYRANFDPDYGTIIIPDTYSDVISRDAKFEVVTSVLAKKLKLERQSDVIGHKRLVMTIDKDDKTREP